MIDNHYIVEWSRQFPWRQDEFVEQDLLISRAIVAIYSDPDEAWANVRANIVDRLMTDEDRAELSKRKTGPIGV